MSDNSTLKFARFVAEKFSVNREGWHYSRTRGDLKHIRYESDYTGYNHWTKRLARTLREVNPFHYFLSKDGFLPRKRTLKGYYWHAVVSPGVYLRKDKNLPDGRVNGNITHWEEDGEYITLFQPLVGMTVLDFLDAEPDHPFAVKIREQIEAAAKRIHYHEEDWD